jgi:hypothetical protein
MNKWWAILVVGLYLLLLLALAVTVGLGLLDIIQ